jgi:Tfp pilus assembly protein PilV
MVRRFAFTMIELIFAIVVIAIAVVSLPVMTQTTDKGIESNIVQEAIFASQAIINESIAYYWDENSLADQYISGDSFSRVIDTTGTSCTGFPNQRPGHINRRCVSVSTIPVTNAAVGPVINYFDAQYNNKQILRNTSSTTAYATYKDLYTATATVTQCSAGCTQFGLNTVEPDLKEIAFDINDGSGNLIIKLRGYSANIGEVDVATRTLP